MGILEELVLKGSRYHILLYEHVKSSKKMFKKIRQKLSRWLSGRVLATKTSDLSLIPKPTWKKERTNSWQVHTHVCVCMDIHICTQNKYI